MNRFCADVASSAMKTMAPVVNSGLTPDAFDARINASPINALISSGGDDSLSMALVIAVEEIGL